MSTVEYALETYRALRTDVAGILERIDQTLDVLQRQAEMNSRNANSEAMTVIRQPLSNPANENVPVTPRPEIVSRPARTREKWTAHDEEIFFRMLSEGATNAAIAEATHKTLSQVQNKRKTEGRRGRLLGTGRPIA